MGIATVGALVGCLVGRLVGFDEGVVGCNFVGAGAVGLVGTTIGGLLPIDVTGLLCVGAKVVTGGTVNITAMVGRAVVRTGDFVGGFDSFLGYSVVGDPVGVVGEGVTTGNLVGARDVSVDFVGMAVGEVVRMPEVACVGVLEILVETVGRNV